MDTAALATRVADRFGEHLLASDDFRGQASVTIRPDTLVDMLVFLRDEADLDFNMLMDIGGVDYLDYDDREWRFEVVYQMYSLELNHRFRIKVAITDDTVSLPSVWTLWRVANWMEREVFDLFGLNFMGHPNLRRILCHEDFKGHALRKDYPINRRQTLSSPVEMILTDDPDWA
jgi:NADH-quinone oxidoreductase subunit C